MLNAIFINVDTNINILNENINFQFANINLQK